MTGAKVNGAKSERRQQPTASTAASLALLSRWRGLLFTPLTFRAVHLSAPDSWRCLFFAPFILSFPAMSAALPFVPLAFERLPPHESLARARAHYAQMDRRRTTRHFGIDPVPRELVELAIRSAGTAPSGAHQQPWTFVAVSDASLKQQMRDAAEVEERAFYAGRATPGTP